MRTARLLVLAPAALAAGAAVAADPVDSVDLQVGPRDRVRGTLRPAEERESFLVPVLRGTRVVATARRIGKTGPVPSFDVLDGAAATVASGAATSSGARLRGFSFATTGDHSFRVAGDGTDGDYRLDLALTPRTRWTADSETDLEPGAETTFAFAAPAGARVTVDLRAPRGSALAPLLADVTDPRGVVTAADGALAKAARHRMTFTTTNPGEHVVRFGNAGTGAGGFRIVVSLRAARQRRRTVDIRDGLLGGEFEGARPVFGRIADPAFDTTILVPDGLGLDGVTLTVPAGSVSQPTLISLTESEPFFVTDDEFAAGTTLSFSPSGTAFDATNPAQMTLPFDPDAFDDPASELAIAVQDPESGEIERVAASAVDLPNATASFPVAHFSRFQPISPRARPMRGRFVDLELTARVGKDFGAEFVVARNGVRLDRGTPRDAGTGVRTLARASVGWGLGEAGQPVLRAGTEARVVPVTARIPADGSIVVQSSETEDLAISRGRGGDALAAAVVRGADTVTFHAVLRRTRGLPTRTNLAGAWHAQVLELAAAKTEARRVAVALSSAEFELEVDETGRISAEPVQVRTSRQIFPDSPWKHSAERRTPKAALLQPDGENARLRLPLGGGSTALDEVQLAPVLRGDLLVGVTTQAAGDPDDATAAGMRIVVLVRTSRGARAADLPANLLLTAFSVRAVNGAVPPHGLEFAVTSGDLAFEAGGSVTVTASRSSLAHDILGAGTIGTEAAGGTAAARLTSDGRLSGGAALGQAFLPPGRALLVIVAGGGVGNHRIGVALPSRPPVK